MASGRADRTRPPSGRRSSGSSRSARPGPTSSSTTRRWRRRASGCWPPIPSLAGRRVVLYAPTFRGRGIGKRAATGLDAAALRAALPAGDALVLKTHPNLDPAATPTDGFDVVVDPTAEINDLLALTDILITDYSSSVIEFALLRRPIVLLVRDLADYELDPGLYLDYRTEMIGTQVIDTDGVDRRDRRRSVRPRRLRRLHRTAARRRAGRCERPLRRPVPRGAGRGPGSEVIQFRPMSATSEVPAAFRNAAGERGPLRLIREAIADIRSRQRLVRYLVPADIRKRGADTLLGNIWWVLDPLLQMVVYVVFVTIIVHASRCPDYPLFIFAAILPWKWFTATIDRRHVVDRRQGPADQADPVPEDRPADGGDGRRHRQLRVRDDRRSCS